ncbi:MAG TPA: nucleotidyltransferase family protein [Candidatus Acidoferrales bacterium]|nr:nucleotidyltransferase family protein [Candidatus Acidoferrales bacterium]
MRARESEKHVKPEMELLLCCARRTLDTAQAARLKEILQGPLDWELLFPMATQSGLLPLLCKHLRDLGTLPDQFREANRQNSLRALFLTAELLRIADRFREREIPAMPYKGPVLGQIAYDNPQLRQFDDLDFVVPQRFIADAYQEMEALGYEPKFQRPRASLRTDARIPGEYVFVHRVNGAMVEIHTEATLRHFPRPPNIEDMGHRSIEITLNGRRIRTFDSADTLLLLCIHGAKDFWSRLIWVADVAQMIKKLAAADWESVLAEAKEHDAERMLRLGLWLARATFGSELPVSVLQNAERDRAVARIGNELCEQLLHRKKEPQGIVWRSHYRMRMVHPAWKGVLYWLHLSIAPAEEDWAALSDGRGHGVRYALLRPLRLWRKYRRSAESKPQDQRKG